ncbi:MAG: PorT family protein [Bdellovibrio sp.]|nr:PorT family protein [Bdellovibrio sp.]
MKKLLALVIVMASTTVFAQKNSPNFSYSMAGIEGGFKWSSADVDNADSNKSTIGYTVGGSAVFNIAPAFGLKTGLFYNERPFESTVAGTTVKGKVSYVDVPVLFMFKFEEYAGIYIGPSLSMKLADEVSPGKLNSVKGMVIPLTVGGQFKFAPNLGVNIYFETVTSEIATGVKNTRAVGANLLLTFD